MATLPAVTSSVPAVAATLTAPQLTAPSRAQPQAKPDFLDHATKFPTTLSNMCAYFKLFYYSIDWVRILVAPQSFSPRSWEILDFVHATTKNGKEIAVLAEVPETLNGLRHDVVNLSKAATPEKKREFTAEVISRGARLYNNLFDMLKLADKIFPVSAATFTILSRLNFASMVIGPGHLFLKEVSSIKKINNEYTVAQAPQAKTELAKKWNLGLFKAISSVSYVVMGTIGLVAAAMAVKVGTVVYLSCLTSAVAFKVIGHFYGEMNGIGKAATPALAQAHAVEQLSPAPLAAATA